MKLPTPQILKDLYSSYYHNNHLRNNKKIISSHWSYYSDFFSVTIDEKGDVLDLKGIAFGDQMIKNPLLKIAHWIGHFMYISKNKGKKENIFLLQKAAKTCREAGYSVSFDVFKQVLSLKLIKSRFHNTMKLKKKLYFLVIGDGYGFMSCFLKKIFPDASVILVDLGKTLFFQACYCQTVYHTGNHVMIGENHSYIDDFDFLYCPADRLEHFSCLLQKSGLKIDVSINIASMQEMTPEMVGQYFKFMRQHLCFENLFYCCNREKKILRGGEVLEFKNYPYLDQDIHYIDEYCPWYWFFLTARPYVYQNKPRFLGVKVPFINYFDGPFMHRLSK